MSLNAEQLEYLRDRGLSLDDAIELARLGETRSSAAERQARYRARKAQSDVTRYVTPASKEIPPDPHKKHTPPVEAKASTAPTGGRAERGSKIPEDWTPPAIEDLSPEAQKLASQWPAASYRAEAEAFKNFWLAETRASSRKANWNRAWANRIVDVHGKVMRQARFASAEPETVDETKWTPERRAEYARRFATGPPGQSVGNVAAGIMAKARVGNG